MAKQQLHPGARWLFRLQAYGWLLLFLFISLIIVISIWAATIAPEGEEPLTPEESAQFFLLIVNVLKLGIAVTIGVLVIFGEIYARMAYNRFFYELAEEGLKVERGIIWKKYSTVPYVRIQNVDIERGIIARILGFSSLSIQTAGYAAGPQTLYGRTAPEGFLPAVDLKEAEKIRELLLKKIKKGKGV